MLIILSELRSKSKADLYLFPGPRHYSAVPQIFHRFSSHAFSCKSKSVVLSKSTDKAGLGQSIEYQHRCTGQHGGESEQTSADEPHPDPVTAKRFDPEEIWGKGFDLHSALRVCPHPGCPNYHSFRRIPCPGDPDEYHSTNIVLSIDGACRGNGTGTARSAYGVHFAKNSPHNFNGTIPGTRHESESRACGLQEGPWYSGATSEPVLHRL